MDMQSSSWIRLNLQQQHSQGKHLSNLYLVPVLEAAGYKQAKHTHGLFIHETNSVKFVLTVDDFGVRYVNKEDAEHLHQTLLKAKYKCTTDWEGKLYCGLHLRWELEGKNHEDRHVGISMPGYVEKAIKRFEHQKPSKPEAAPHPFVPPNYGARQQLTEELDKTEPINKDQKQLLQEVIGTFLFYARAVDSTMLVALGTLAASQTCGTEKTMTAMVQLLNYAASNPDFEVIFWASEMQLTMESDASYLSEPKARSRVGGYLYLSNKNNADPNKQPMMNGAVLVISQILKNVMASAAEAEVGGLFVNGQEGLPIRTALEEMGWKQQPTPIATDNQTAKGIANETVKQRRSKAIDMRFYWIRDRVKQGQFIIIWRKGATNLADYFTKHHSPTHHKEMRQVYNKTTRNNIGQANSACKGVLKTLTLDGKTPRERAWPELYDVYPYPKNE